MRYTERIYHDRQPIVGDTIECTHTNANLANQHVKGNVLIITQIEALTGDCVFAYNKRTGAKVCIHYSFYRIFTDITYVKTGEQHIVKRFLGIPLYRKTIDIYEEE